MPPLKRRLEFALDNRALREAVLKSCRHSVAARDAVVGELDDYEAARNKAREIRQTALDNLNPLLDEFTARFTDAGGTVHYAADSATACAAIIDIISRQPSAISRQPSAVSHQPSVISQGVKSKSMVSEEIGLGEALNEAGIDAVESDLGEFIVQLAGEPPSHITAPALHRSRRSIGQLFYKHLGIDFTDDPAKLTQAARAHLRQRFLKADFGISGGNFLIADTGHIVIVENEGNAKMGLSLPPLYIAVTGLEKVIPSLHDLPHLLALLPRSATGQRITSYVHLLRPTREGEDGPCEMHLVVVDNGRRWALNDPVLREMLLCIRCGACLNICPVYQTVGGHAYGSVYPGPMGAVLSNLIGDRPEDYAELPNLSTLCGACRDVCPVKIDIPKLLLELRARLSKPMRERAAAMGWGWVMSSARRAELAGRAARIANSLLPNGLPGGWLDDVGRSFREGGGC